MHPPWCYISAANEIKWQEWQYTFSTSSDCWNSWTVSFQQQIVKRTGLPGGYKHDTNHHVCMQTQKTHAPETQRGWLSLEMGNPVCQLSPRMWPGRTIRNRLDEGNATTCYTKDHGPGKGIGFTGLQLLIFFWIVELHPLPNPLFPDCLKGSGPTPM